MTRLTVALDQLKLARGYLLHLLSTVPDSDWYRMPAGATTHIGWQVGHLVIAHYNLLLDRTRGQRPSDEDLMPVEVYRQLFGRLTQPSEQTGQYPAPTALRQTLMVVHAQALKELSTLQDDELDAPCVNAKPHPIVTTKLSALLWCGQHEMLHAGQIGLLKRLLGGEPQW